MLAEHEIYIHTLTLHVCLGILSMCVRMHIKNNEETMIIMQGQTPDQTLKKPLYSIKEVCELLGISSDTVRRWIKSGQLKAVKVGIQWRVKRESIQDILDSGTPA